MLEEFIYSAVCPCIVQGKLAKMKKSSDLDPRVEQPRTCSNPVCKNEETKVLFKF